LAKVPARFYDKHSGLTREQCAMDHPKATSVKWIGSRTLILSLSGESTLSTPMWVTDGWLMAYDLEQRKFFLNDDLIDQNSGELNPVLRGVSESLENSQH
jgi:hypothetical protein